MAELLEANCACTVGNIVTVIVSVTTQPLAVKVKVYGTIIGAAVVLINISFIILPLLLLAGLRIPTTAGLLQLNEVFTTVLCAV